MRARNRIYARGSNYDYGMPTQSEAKDIVFDIKVDKTGIDSTYLDDIKSGHVADNTHHRNLYIANPKNAKGSFTVEVSIYVLSQIRRQGT